ncbi:MAG: hypothetical protein PWP11_986 [Thauera sp.]|nr:hypothetical protein [Thauera sp.]
MGVSIEMHSPFAGRARQRGGVPIQAGRNGNTSGTSSSTPIE